MNLCISLSLFRNSFSFSIIFERLVEMSLGFQEAALLDNYEQEWDEKYALKLDFVVKNCKYVMIIHPPLATKKNARAALLHCW